MELVVVQGDIADEVADVLVSPDDTRLSMSGGASAALAETAGDELPAAAQQQAPVDVGEVVVTPAFDLFADYVVHAAATTAGATPDAIREVVERALTAAAEHGCDSVVFPLIGGGVGGVDQQTSARTIYEAVEDWSEPHPSEARLIVRSGSQYEEVFEAIEQIRLDGG
jgi:O-acetyl-ADP-ribose deacetylase (regulator of RNase III)